MNPVPAIAIPPKVRFALYLLTAIGSAVVSYCVTKNYIGDAEVALFTGLAAIVNALAAFNTPTADADVTA